MSWRDSARIKSKPVASGVFLALVLLSPFLVVGAQQPPASAPKRILVLYWYDREYASDALFPETFQAALKSAPPGSVEYYSEFLESNRFPGEGQSRLLREYLRKKYADRTIDVVVATADAPLYFLLNYRSELFPHAPIIFGAVSRPSAKDIAAEPGMTGIVYGYDLKNTLESALKLHPGLAEAFIISGTLEGDKRLEILAREQLEGYEDRVRITYLTDLTREELTLKTKSLPERSIVIYVWQQTRNQQGKVVESREILPMIVNSSKVPIYGLASWQVGRGIVGGYVRLNETAGARVGEIVLRIVQGERARDIPVESATTVPMYDWRELRRWGISEDELPAGSIVQFIQRTFWEQHKWRIIGVIGLILLQASIIGVLLIERKGRQRAISELDQLNAELEHRVGERTEELASKTRELEAFTYTVAHDLKAPLRGIDGYSRLLLEDYMNALDDQGQGFLQTIRSSAGQMKQLIEDLLAYSRAERRELTPSRIELRPFVEKLVEERRSDLKARGIEVTLNLNGKSVTADPAALGQALRNYLDNAVKFTRHSPDPRIEIGGELNDQVLRLWVSDNGSGFDLKYHDEIFDIFHRLHRAEDYPGTGIGLAIVRKAIERMNGRVWAESAPGCGATFYIEIPTSPREAALR